MHVAEDVTIYADPMIVMANKAFRETARDSSVPRLERFRLPTGFEFLVIIREDSLKIVMGDSVALRLKKTLIYRACVFMYNFGLRFCNASLDTADGEPHANRRCDVVVFLGLFDVLLFSYRFSSC